eukprot:6589230-Pyramimonas_sp.AAC.1
MPPVRYTGTPGTGGSRNMTRPTPMKMAVTRPRGVPSKLVLSQLRKRVVSFPTPTFTPKKKIPSCSVRRAVSGGSEGICRSSLDARRPWNRDDKVKNTGGIYRVCCTVHEGHKRPKCGCNQRCEHPGVRGGISGFRYKQGILGKLWGVECTLAVIGTGGP